MSLQHSRREFLKRSFGVLGGIAFVRIAQIFPEISPLLAQVGNDSSIDDLIPDNLEVGEIYSGFLLLPEGASVPDFVQPALNGMPIICGVGVETGDSIQPNAVSTSFETVEGLASVIDFPVYTVNSLTDGLVILGASLVQHETGETFTTSVVFGLVDQATKESTAIVSIRAEPDFPKPFPLWASVSVEDGGPSVSLEKVDFLPIPGIMVSMSTGFAFHWIEGTILYTLIVHEEMFLFEEVQNLIGQLSITNGD